MGTVPNRGTKDNPHWCVGYRQNGRWVYKASRQPTKALVKRWVQEIESRIARGQVGIKDHDAAPMFKALLDARGRHFRGAFVVPESPGQDEVEELSGSEIRKRSRCSP